MAVEAAAGPMKGKLVVRNIGLLLSGDLGQPILDADTIVAVDGRITAIGKGKGIDADKADLVIDAKDCAVAPGLIDSHCHPVFGDWTPRQNQLGWINSCVNGGVTTFVSAGEVHLPGRPKDPIGVKALAITAQRTFANFRPSGAKVMAGAPVPEKTMGEEDYAELARAGVTMIGEIGLGTVNTGPEAKKHVDWCRKHGIQTIIHTGGPSIPGSNLISHEVVLEADPDVVSHINGGHTALGVEPYLPAVRAGQGRHRDRAQRQRKGCHHGVESRRRIEAHARGHHRHRRAGRIGRAAARHPAHDCVPGELRRLGAREGLLHGDRQHGARAQAGCRIDRDRTSRPILCSSTRPSTPRARRCSSPSRWAICRASAW